MHSNVPWYVMLVDGRYKYVRPLVPDLEELYDLKNDPEEPRQPRDQARVPRALKRLRAAAIAELREDGAGFVDNMPPVRSAPQ